MGLLYCVCNKSRCAVCCEWLGASILHMRLHMSMASAISGALKPLKRHSVPWSQPFKVGCANVLVTLAWAPPRHWPVRRFAAESLAAPLRPLTLTLHASRLGLAWVSTP